MPTALVHLADLAADIASGAPAGAVEVAGRMTEGGSMVIGSLVMVVLGDKAVVGVERIAVAEAAVGTADVVGVENRMRGCERLERRS